MFHLLRLNHCPIYQQLQIEEALLRADHRNWCLINSNSTPAIVMGISSKPSLFLNQSLIEQKPLPVIRRFSGGGTVVVDPNTCFVTWICNEETLNIPCFPESVLRWTETFYRPLFAKQPFAVRENDYVIGEKKMGGNAQYLSKKRWLHHTSFLWDFDTTKMDYLLIPPRMPRYRGNRSHSEFLYRLCTIFPSKELFQNAIIARLKELFSVTEVPFESVQQIQQRPHRQVTALISSAEISTPSVKLSSFSHF